MKATNHSVTHGSFTVERTYDAGVDRVFAALSQPEAKAKWFTGPPEWTMENRSMDFRVGGRETSAVGPQGGPRHTFEAEYLDIVPNSRIIISYVMHIGDAKISASLQTIELSPAGKGTRLVLTEHGAFLDGYDDAGSRERGTRGLLEQLAKAL